MKRYKIAHRYPGNLGCNEDPNGEWVLWEDVQACCAKLGHDNSLTGLYERVGCLEEKTELNSDAVIGIVCTDIANGNMIRTALKRFMSR